MCDLVIFKMSDCAASVAGGKDIILLCDKVTKGKLDVTPNYVLHKTITFSSEVLCFRFVRFCSHCISKRLNTYHSILFGSLSSKYNSLIIAKNPSKALR